MTRRELIDRVCATIPEGGPTPRQVAQVIDGVFGAITEAIAGDGKYTHPGFGTFTVKTRAARPGRNPRTGESIEIAESTTVAFKPATELKDRIER